MILQKQDVTTKTLIDGLYIKVTEKGLERVAKVTSFEYLNNQDNPDSVVISWLYEQDNKHDVFGNTLSGWSIIPTPGVKLYTELDRLIDKVAAARQAKAEAESLVKEVTDLYPVVFQVLANRTEVNKEVAKLEKELRDFTVNFFIETGENKDNLPSEVAIQEHLPLVYNKRKLLTWLAEHQPGHLSYDEKDVQRLLSGLDSVTRDLLEVETVSKPIYTATISTKLGKD